MIEEEKIVIHETFAISQQRLQETIRKLSETINISGFIEKMKYELPDD